LNSVVGIGHLLALRLKSGVRRMVERNIRIKPDDFGTLYRVMVIARQNGSEHRLEPWEQAFEQELYFKLARRLSRRGHRC